MKRVTIKDIARAAGVNHTTVSRVINNDPSISEITKKKVLKIIKKMNYYPNTAARTLVKGKTNTIAFAAPYLTSQAELDIITGIGDRLRETGSTYEMTFYTGREATGYRDMIIRNILYGRKADGLIVTSFHLKPSIVSEFRKSKFPLVIIEDYVKGAHSIMTDSYRGGFMATEHLIEKGRKKIAYIAGGKLQPYSLLTLKNYDGERYRGYRDAMSRHKIKSTEKLIIRIDMSSPVHGAEAFRELMEKAPDTDAIFCAAGDMVAVGILKQARKMGIKIPSDIAIVGYDNNIISDLVNPSLTTVTNHHIQMGSAAFDIVMSEIKHGTGKPRTIKYEPELVVRNST